MPSLFSVFSAGEIRFGRGQLDTVAGWVAQRSERVMLVHGSSSARAAVLLGQLAGAGLDAHTFSVAREPSLEDIRNGVEQAREASIKVIVSLGGGAVIDAGKAIAALVPANGSIIEYLEVVGNGRLLESAPLPFVAIPTTAGTGAEVTKNAVINVPEQRRKVSLRDNRMLPDLAVVDPSLTDRTPRSVTLASGLDALTQVIEPYVCNRANTFTDMLCRDAIPRAMNALRTLMEKECAASRDDMAWVSLCGGLALANAGLGVIHGLAGPLGGLCDAPHGALCGTLLPYGLELNLENVASEESLSRLEEIRDALALSFSVPTTQAFTALADWSHRHGLGTLRELGVPYEALEAAAEAALNASSMRANPAKLSQSQLLSLLHKAW
ncbi:iron-containing alcohol dehydrogenase [Klebsiella variicola]|uniref:iron-containing alcohol dehydrogenase n=1 Tax=Klebsiella variicola TaxID=244366 RepID=UPI003B280FBC